MLAPEQEKLQAELETFGFGIPFFNPITGKLERCPVELMWGVL